MIVQLSARINDQHRYSCVDQFRRSKFEDALSRSAFFLVLPRDAFVVISQPFCSSLEEQQPLSADIQRRRESGDPCERDVRRIRPGNVLQALGTVEMRRLRLPEPGRRQEAPHQQRPAPEFRQMVAEPDVGARRSL